MQQRQGIAVAAAPADAAVGPLQQTPEQETTAKTAAVAEVAAAEEAEAEAVGPLQQSPARNRELIINTFKSTKPQDRSQRERLLREIYLRNEMLDVYIFASVVQSKYLNKLGHSLFVSSPE